jgi:coenzyme Q-binding protein COQ10
MFQASKVLPYPAAFLKEIVVDVEQYAAFLPMLKAVAIYPKTAEFFEADLTIGVGAFDKTYRSEVFVFDDAVEAKAKTDGTFKFLESRWHFTNYENNRCLVNFTLDFKLQSALLQITVGKLLDNAAQTMMTAFEQRAARLWQQPEDDYDG